MSHFRIRVTLAMTVALLLALLLASVALAQTMRTGRVNRDANLRAGPGVNHAVIGGARSGQLIEITGANADQSWWQLADGKWIAAFLVTIVTPGEEQPTPAPPPSPATGELLKDNRRSVGGGHLTVHNGTRKDGVVALMPANGNTPVIAFYIKAGDRYTFVGVPDGAYELIFATGVAWNRELGRFTQQASYERFADQMGYATTASQYDIWTVTLHPVPDGKATTYPMAATAFPTLSQP
jgi:hypothetical protein